MYISLVEGKAAEVVAACLRPGVERRDLLGSAVGGSFDLARSDLDFMVSFEQREPPDLFGRYFCLKEALKSLFGRHVDLIVEGALCKAPPFAESARETRPPVRGLSEHERIVGFRNVLIYGYHLVDDELVR